VRLGTFFDSLEAIIGRPCDAGLHDTWPMDFHCMRVLWTDITAVVQHYGRQLENIPMFRPAEGIKFT
jgi:hypothetical protein